MKTISVIIPAFNAGKTIEKAILSCLSQSVAPLEIIVVDDGSTDDTLQKVLQLNQESIQFISLLENSGVSNARNLAWDLAEGDYIAFLDSDDQWHPQKLQYILAHLQSNESIDLLFHPYTTNEFGKEQTENKKISLCSFSSFLWSNPAQTSCICIRSSLPLRFNAQMRYCEDHDLLLQIAYKYNCFKLPLKLTKLGRPQLAKGGLSENHWEMRKGEMKAYAHLYHLNKGFILLIPFLYLFSLMKYWRKKIQLNFSNYDF